MDRDTELMLALSPQNIPPYPPNTHTQLPGQLTQVKGKESGESADRPAMDGQSELMKC